MGIYDPNDVTDRDEPDGKAGGSGAGIAATFKLAGLFIGLLFFPAAIVSWLVFLIGFRFGRLRPSVLTALATIGLAALAWAWWMANPLEAIMAQVALVDPRLMDWTVLIMPAGIITTALGLIGGVWYAAYQANEMEIKPWYTTHDENDWRYRFTERYRMTPLEWWQDRKVRRELVDGALTTPTFAPLGVDPVRHTPVGLFEQERTTHMLITGGTNSGKTTSQKALIRNSFESGFPIILLDLKASETLRAYVADLCTQYGRTLLNFSPEREYAYNVPNSPGQATYDPFPLTSQAMIELIPDRVLEMREYSDEYFKQSARSLLQNIAKALTVIVPLRRLHKRAQQQAAPESPAYVAHTVALQQLGEEFDWDHGGARLICSLLDRTKLSYLHSATVYAHQDVYQQYAYATANPYPDPEAQRKRILRLQSDLATTSEAAANLEFILQSLLSKNARERAMFTEVFQSLYAQLSGLTESTFGAWMARRPEGDPRHHLHIDLYEATKDSNPNPPVILFSIPSNKYPDAAQYFGGLFVADLTAVSDFRLADRARNKVHAYIDEFQSLSPGKVKGILEKARESGISIILSFQSLSQITEKGTAALARAFVETVGNLLIHSGCTKSTATFYSEVAGTQEVTVHTVSRLDEKFVFSWWRNWVNRRQTSVTTSEVEKPVIPSNIIVHLKPQEEAVLISKFCADPVIIAESNKRGSFMRWRKRNVKSAGSVARKIDLIPSRMALKTYDD